MNQFKVKRIDHLGFVVRDLDKTLPKWEKLFGVKAEVKENPELQVRLAVIEIGGVRFVFNESTHPASRWAKFLDEKGEGLEHIALEVDDLEAASQAAKAAGLSLRFSEPKPIHGFLTNFVDQRDLDAVTLEFMGPDGKSEKREGGQDD